MIDIVIFEDDTRQVEARLEGETVWLSVQQLADLFARDKSVISRHLKNIFDSNELDRDSVVARNATTAGGGKTYQVDYYNLDANREVYGVLRYGVIETRERYWLRWKEAEANPAAGDNPLLRALGQLCASEPKIGVRVAEVRIKKMKTRWGSCNTEARRIWLNLELAKKPPSCLEYILVHEMVHIFERHHNERFRDLMESQMPSWRLWHEELNRAPLAHDDWDY